MMTQYIREEQELPDSTGSKWKMCAEQKTKYDIQFLFPVEKK